MEALRLLEESYPATLGLANVCLHSDNGPIQVILSHDSCKLGAQQMPEELGAGIQSAPVFKPKPRCSDRRIQQWAKKESLLRKAMTPNDLRVDRQLTRKLLPP